MGLGMAALLAGFGGTLLLTGLGLVWATRAETEKVKAAVLRPATNSRLATTMRVTDPARRPERRGLTEPSPFLW